MAADARRPVERRLRWPRLFRLLLLLFPRRFRDRHGSDLASLCAEMDGRAYAGRRGRLARDLIRNGLAARFDDLRQRWAQQPSAPGALIPDRESSAMDSLLQDIGYALRTLRKSPGFAAVATLSLALGIGANTAVFSIMDAALLEKLPVEQPDELVLLHWFESPAGGLQISHNGWMVGTDDGRRQASSFSYPHFERLAEAAGERAELFGFADLYSLNVRVTDVPELAGGQVVTGNYYDVLGVAPAAGRLIAPADDRPGAEPVAVLSHDFWQRRFGSDPELVGSVIHVNGVPFTIIGVSAPGFRGAMQVGSSPDVTIPMASQAPVMRQGDLSGAASYWWFNVMGRLGPETRAAELEARLEPVLMASIETDLEGVTPERMPDLAVVGGSQGMQERRGFLAETVLTLAWVVALVLLIACTNLANLLLARSSSRQREIAVRQSLGASRARIVRQLLTESVLLAVLGGALGLVLAHWGQGVIVSLGAIDEGLALDTGVDLRLIGFAAGAALLTGLLFGIVPALRATGPRLTASIRESAGAVSGSRRSLLVSKSVLVTQVGLSVVLLVLAGLFLRSLGNLADSIEGFEADEVLLFSVDPRMNHYESSEMHQLYADALRRLRSSPTVRQASVGALTPVGGRMSTTGYAIDGYTPEEDEPVGGLFNYVGADYVEALRIPLVAGRTFAQDDLDGARPVAMVNREFVRQYLAERNPLGVRVGIGETADLGIVGVVEDLPYQQASDDPISTLYVPYTRSGGLGRMTFVLHTRGAPADVLPSARATMRQLDPLLPLIDVRSQERQSRESLASERQLARLSAVMGGIAMLLACVGLYGILSYSVVRRTREIGVRKALGAHHGHVRAIVLRELRPVALGALLGIAGAVYSTRFIESQLYGLGGIDPVSVAGAILLLAAVALGSAWLPARRAASVDPVVALRQE